MLRDQGWKIMINGQRMFLRGYGDDAAYATTAAPPTDRGYDSLYIIILSRTCFSLLPSTPN